MATGPTEYEKKLIEMQFQMKVNNDLMKDCFSDLDSWTKEMNEKEKTILNNPDIVKNSNKGLPPIRTLAEPSKKKKKIKKLKSNEKESKQKPSKINAYDYRKWDKLDVDKLCEEVDNKPASSESEYTTDEEWEEEYRKTKANWEKERGNQFFKDNLIIEAIECYTKAIEYDPVNPIYLCNRAQCLIKQEKYSAAEKDCTLAISLDPKYIKAYHRRATCRVSLKKFDEAKADYDELLKLEPNNKLFQNELNNLQKSMESNQLVFPIIKSEEQRSKKPLRRINIEEINDESSEKSQLEKNLKEINQKIKLSSKEKELFNLNIEKKETNKPLIVPISESIPINDNKVEELNEKLIKTELNEKANAIVNEKDQKIISKKSFTIPDSPKNGYQFKKDWQTLCNNLDDLAAYFKKISPSDYPKIFLNGLESDTLSKIFLILQNYFINDPDTDVFENLKYLAQVKRFNTQLMFLTQDDKNCKLFLILTLTRFQFLQQKIQNTVDIKEIFEHLNNKRTLAELEPLKKLYDF